MRVAHVAASLHYGGAERMLVDLAMAHAAEGLEPAIVAPAGALDRDWGHLGIARIQVPRAHRRPADVMRTALAVRAALRAFRPDVVHAHNVKSASLALAARRGLRPRPPVLATLHGVAGRQIRAAAQILRFADMVAAVSEELRDAVVAGGLSPPRVEVVHNGVSEVPALTPAQRAAYDRELGLERHVVAAVGRLEPEKAHELFLATAAIVRQALPDTTFLLVGQGRRAEELERLAGGLGIADVVRFTGPRLDARALIDRADVLVFSSLREGHSMAAIEALAAGTPVVSTDVSGMRELLSTGAGVVVEGREPRRLGDAIVELLGDPARRARMADAGRSLVRERFSRAQMQQHYAELYVRLRRAMPAPADA